jgi:hypothetical protein
MGCETGSIYSGDPGVDRSHLIQRITHSICSQLSLALSGIPCGSAQLRGSSWPGSIIPSHPLPTLLEPEPLFLTNSFWNAARGAAECWWWALCLLAPPFHHNAILRRRSETSFWDAVLRRHDCIRLTPIVIISYWHLTWKSCRPANRLHPNVVLRRRSETTAKWNRLGTLSTWVYLAS